MNFLAHLHLAGSDPQSRVGSVLADFVRGRRADLEERFPVGIVDGIEHHRAVDHFMDHHDCVREARAMLHPSYGHRSRVIVDVLFDYFLGIHWDEVAGDDFDEFVAASYHALRPELEEAPERYAQFIDVVLEYDLLRLYGTWDGMEETFHRLNYRFSRPLPVDGLMADLARMEDEISRCFLRFYPEVLAEVPPTSVVSGSRSN